MIEITFKDFHEDRYPREELHKMLEPIMIQKLRPSLNILVNLNPSPDNTPIKD